MAERIDPDNEIFKDKVSWKRALGFIPIPVVQSNPFREAFLWRYSWAATYCKNMRVLDVPCGMGWGTSLLTGSKQLFGIDRDPDAIAEARKRYGSLAQFEVGDMADLPATIQGYDVICCLEGIEHVECAVALKFFDWCFSALTPTGVLLISSPFRKDGKHSGNPFHIHEYQPDELAAILKNKFEIRNIEERQVEELTVAYFEVRKGLP
ncbi:MAG: class I SAM-dependent methyltransferase [Bdellovibrionales bacterium]|nr:class I SAM-dependent methyltransferase [Bdellovibrionales bacterium]